MAKVKLLDPSDPRRKLDRYELIGEIATGGMATVFLARRGGVGGFQRFVAIKRLHPHLQSEPEFVEMFLDEARLAALIHHPNVVPILEVGESEAGYYLVMEYVEGDTLSKIVARSMSLGQMPPRQVILRIMLDTLAGLDAAHELKDDRGQLLGLVHRDCSPQNVLVGVDGSARITDFGVARASSRLTSTAHGKLKGKLAYMAPEQTRGDELDRRTDLFAMGIIFWEILCGKRLFKADNEAATLQRILVEPIRPPSQLNSDIPAAYDKVVLKALDRSAERRYQTAADFADAVEAAGREAAKDSINDVGIASPREVASYVQQILGQEIGAQRESVRAWLAQSDSGQEVIIAGDVAGRPGAPRTHAAATSGDSSPNLRYEVAADVTMRFALEAKKDSQLPAPTPPPVSMHPVVSAGPASPLKPAPLPPPPDSQRAPPPPRLPPPAKPSQPTLLGQGPIARDGQISSAPMPAAGRPPEPAPTQRGIAKLDSQHDSHTAQQQFDLVDPDDLGEDAVTVARRADSGVPPEVAAESVIQPQVKTSRGLFAKDHEAPNGSGNLSGIKHTPRMPLTPRMAGVPDAKVQIAKAALAAGVTTAVQEAIPIEGVSPSGPAAQRSPSGHPRTLVSASPNPAITGEVSAGGFTPGSMTLPTPATGLDPSSYNSNYPGEMSDPTLVHAVPKRPIGRYIVVLAAFLFVFAGGLIFLKLREPKPDTASRGPETEKPEPKKLAPTTEPARTPEPTSTATNEPSATPSASETTDPGHDKKRPRTAKTGQAADTAMPTSKPTAQPTSEPTTKATSKPEDLTNPYR